MPLKLTNKHCFAYAMPVVTTVWLMAPLGVLQGIYAKYYGLPLTTIATVMLLVRMFDAISDPLIGYYSDRYHRKTGNYNLFIFVGGAMFAISGYFLYAPPTVVNEIYFMSWLLAFYLFWTIFEMPHMAWASELAKISEAKTLVFSYRNFANFLGLLAFYSIPLLPIFGTQSITPQTLEFSVSLAGILMVPFLIICLMKTPVGTKSKSTSDSPDFYPNVVANELNKSFLFFLRLITTNKPLLLFIGAYFAINVGVGLWYSLIFLYVDAYLGLGDQFAKMFLVAFIFGAFSTPIWYKLAVLLGKRTVWFLATIMLIFSFIYTGLLSPNNTSFLELSFLKIIQTLGFSCMNVVAPAMLSEIIDFSNWKYKTDRGASLFAIYAFSSKTALAISTALGLGIAGWFGFDATLATHADAQVFGLVMAISWLPPVFAVLGLIFIYFSPINERRHQILSYRIDPKLRENYSIYRNRRNL